MLLTIQALLDSSLRGMTLNDHTCYYKQVLDANSVVSRESQTRILIYNDFDP